MLFLNERSLEGQFISAHLFMANLQLVMKCQRDVRAKGFPMYVRSRLVGNPATSESTFSGILYSSGDRDLIAQVRIWLMKDGPFWDHNKQHGENEWFECLEELVTDSSLAEAAWQQEQGTVATVFSFTGSRFTISPLKVTWRERLDGETEHSIPNFWDSESLLAFIATLRQPAGSWEELIDYAESQFSNLTIGASILDKLASRPFVSSIASRTLELLRVLDELNGCVVRGDAPAETAILTKYFAGSRPWFSGESQSRRNNEDVKSGMTFRDPRTGKDLHCPWHGKISHQYFRLHFEWPKVDRTSKLLVVYLGPHL